MHLIVAFRNLADIPDFLGHFKTESAQALNSFLGRNKRAVWCDGYDSPTVLTMSKTIAVIGYSYSNPAKNNLVGSVDEYPAFFTWKMFRRRQLTRFGKGIRGLQYRALTSDGHNPGGDTREAERLVRDEPFTLEPNAWLEAFGIPLPSEQERIKAGIMQLVRYLEVRAKRKRQR